MGYLAGMLLFYILLDEPEEVTIVLNCDAVTEQTNGSDER